MYQIKNIIYKIIKFVTFLINSVNIFYTTALSSARELCKGLITNYRKQTNKQTIGLTNYRKVKDRLHIISYFSNFYKTLKLTLFSNICIEPTAILIDFLSCS